MPIVKAMKERVMQASRGKKLEHFYSLYKGGTILDVGVSSHARIQGENLFLEKFRYGPELYTGLGVEDLTEVAAAHPGKHFIRYGGGRFPFKDKEFDWAPSNAVIEQVGDDSAQLLFINDMLRVAKQVFFATPNKFFHVESHTNVVLLHRLPGRVFYQWRDRRKKYWDENNIRLLGYGKLCSLMKNSNAKTYRIYKNHMFGWPMMFTVTCTAA